MKRSRKFLSLILTICIALSMLTGFAPADTAVEAVVNETSVKADDEFKLPDIVEPEEAEKNGYIGRLKSEENDLYTFVFANGDGTNTMRVYSHPVKYIADDGSVRDISLDIKEKKDGGFVSADHKILTKFESKLTDGISLEYNDIDITVIPKVNANVEATAAVDNDGKTVTYKMDAATSFLYGLTYAGFKEDIVVGEYTGQTEYEFTLLTNGLTLYEEYGSYYLIDAEGKAKALIGDIIIFTADERNNTLGSMTYETVRANQEYVLTIHIDADYLADENTAYPIKIDPSIEVNYDNDGAGAIEDVTINELTTFSGTYGSLYVGRHPAGSLSRVLMRFPNLTLLNISSNNITSATVELRDLMCQGDEDITVECHIYNRTSPVWTESGTTTWTSVGNSYLGPLLDSHTISYGQGNVDGQRHRYAFDITTIARTWSNGSSSPGMGIVFKADDAFENQTGSAVKTWYKTFSSYNRSGDYKPSLSINYIPTPSGGTSFDNAEVLVLNTTYFVNISSANEKKYFKFTPSTTGLYSFSSSANDGDPYAWLYNSSEQQIDYDDDSAGSHNFCLTYHLMAGTVYYFTVGCFNTGTGSYNVCISNANASSKIDCTVMTLGTTKSVNITIPHKIVCYKVTPTETKEYLFFSSNKTGDPEIWIYNSSFGYVDDNDDGAGGLNFRLAITLNAGNTYYIVLRHHYSNVGSFGLNSFYDADIPTGIYYLKNMGSLRFMDIDGPGAQEWVHQWRKHISLQEKWRLNQDSNGYYTMRSEYGAKKYVGISSTSTTEDNIKLYSDISDNTLWKIYINASNALILIPKSATGKVLCAPDDAVGSKLRLKAIYDLSSPNRSSWIIDTDNIYLEFSYDMGFINANRSPAESVSVVKNRIQSNITNEYFPVIAEAFSQQCGVYFITSSITNYTSDADRCPYTGIDTHCSCIEENQCILQYNHNPNSNNSEVGFLYNVHCKSFTRLRNNLIIGIPKNTIRITYSGYDLCFYSRSDGHGYSVVGLSDYVNPIICLNVNQSNRNYSILVLAHELTHSFDIAHHAPVTGQPCIMDTNRYGANDPDDPSTYWCDNCINKIISNKNRWQGDS